ncbi:MAG TPA: TolC family protein [Segetibacter sp.]|jgi:outer membrane protein TolC
MRLILIAILILINNSAFSQVKPNLTNKPELKGNNDSKLKLNEGSSTYTDSLIKDRLVSLALQNPAFAESDADINGAKFEAKQAKSFWLNSITLSGNLNEFVVNNATINGVPASTLFPKYNLGVSIPLGLLGSQEKNIAKEKIKLYTAQKESKTREIKKDVLILYENYKERKDLFDLQKQITDGVYSTYQQLQKDYASGEIKDIKDVNKQYQTWILERSNQRSKEKDLKIAELEIEGLIGMKMSDAINTITVKN